MYNIVILKVKFDSEANASSSTSMAARATEVNSRPRPDFRIWPIASFSKTRKHVSIALSSPYLSTLNAYLSEDLFTRSNSATAPVHKTTTCLLQHVDNRQVP